VITVMPSPPAARVTSRQNPLVTRFRDAARQRGGAGDPLLIEGATLVAEAHAAGWSIEVAAFTDKALAHHEVARLFETLAPGVPCVIAAEPVVEAMSPARTPSGVVALASPRRWTLDEVLAHDGALAVVAVGVQDPGNVGAIVRAAEAAGSTGVIASGMSADPFGWKALRGAMGSAFRLPVVRVPDTDDVLRACRARGLRVIATALDGTPAADVALDVPSAVLVGAEGTGLPQLLVDAADMRLTIPMQPPVQSLNVAVAAGIILYEARRQRALAGGRR
jgi:TrmH family RNA methyltransferase